MSWMMKIESTELALPAAPAAKGRLGWIDVESVSPSEERRGSSLVGPGTGPLKNILGVTSFVVVRNTDQISVILAQAAVSGKLSKPMKIILELAASGGTFTYIAKDCIFTGFSTSADGLSEFELACSKMTYSVSTVYNHA